MKERPILFSAPMVRAILEGRKTQTRWIVKQGKYSLHDLDSPLARNIRAVDGGISFDWMGGQASIPISCPYGKPGDRLWVRETYAWPGEEEPMYRADPYAEELVKKWRSDPNYPQVKWIPSIHMPRIHSRILLEITDVRVQRLQEISEQDAIAEGVERLSDAPACLTPWKNYRLKSGAPFAMNHSIAAASFMSFWDSINGTDAHKVNPWVWAITFKRVEAAERAA